MKIKEKPSEGTVSKSRFKGQTAWQPAKPSLRETDAEPSEVKCSWMMWPSARSGD